MYKIFNSIIFIFLCHYCLLGQSFTFKGRIVSEITREPLEGALIHFKAKSKVIVADADGKFTFTDSLQTAQVLITHYGYKPTTIELSSVKESLILISPHINVLEEVVVSTGYQQLPRERSTGSFTVLSKEVLNRSTGMNIIGRLEGVSNGVIFNRAHNHNGEATPEPELRVRGVSSIYSETAPLVILDGFVFDGNISDINPNDIASVTILKDAAAASIWGSRAGNGVIVIVSQSGKRDESIKVEFNTNLTITKRPDVFYNKSFLSSEALIPLEEELFRKGAYREDPTVPLPYFVEMLIARRDGILTEKEFQEGKQSLLKQDIRNDAKKHLYRTSVMQQYGLNLRGGGKTYSYFLSGGFDEGQEYKIGNSQRRVTFNSVSSLLPIKNLEIKLTLNFSNNFKETNGLGISDLNPSSRFLSPYSTLKDPMGKNSQILKNYRQTYIDVAEDEGLINWHFVPLDEIALADNRKISNTYRMATSLIYDWGFGLKTSALYQVQNTNLSTYNYYDKDTYFVRDRVNRYTQNDGTQIIPYGNIYRSDYTRQRNQSGRFQLDYNRYLKKGDINALGGIELRESVSYSEPGFMAYNYNPETINSETIFNYTQSYILRPTGTGRIPGPSNSFLHNTDRFVSYFLNTSYRHNKKYTLSLSSRWDASNLFGVKTNQKGVPLWSAGLSWDISQEDFFTSQWINTLKPKFTFGYSGNVNTVVSAVPVITYSTDFITGLPRAALNNIGNPGLRWEKVRTTNLGLDFRIFEGRIGGSIEYYRKNIADLIGFLEVDPTTGIHKVYSIYYDIDNRINYASMLTKGVDLEVGVTNFINKLKWNTDIIFNSSTNEITEYYAVEPTNVTSYFSTGAMAPPKKGKPTDAIYSIPWHGIDDKTGNPIVYINGVESTSYATYLNQLKYSDLILSGVTVPKFNSSLRNTFSWKQFSFGFNMMWKAGYVFRKPSISYSLLLNSGQGHSDYLRRWIRPGDASTTQIPSIPDLANQSRDYVYLYSEALIEKGDHIRLLDVNFKYDFNLRNNKRIRLYCYLSNLGILWAKNKQGIDPDYPQAAYPSPLRSSLGLHFTF